MVANIAKEHSEVWKLADGELVAHLGLFELIPAQHDDSFRVVVIQNPPNESLAERSGPPGYENIGAL